MAEVDRNPFGVLSQPQNGHGPGASDRCRRFEVAPIRTVDGFVAYGILMSGAMVHAVSQEQLTPVA
jgi:hypothetical protein